MDGHGRSSTENGSSVMSFQSFLAATSIIPSVDSSIGGGSNDFAGQDPTWDVIITSVSYVISRSSRVSFDARQRMKEG